jgi:hypothetical protein
VSAREHSPTKRDRLSICAAPRVLPSAARYEGHDAVGVPQVGLPLRQRAIGEPRAEPSLRRQLQPHPMANPHEERKLLKALAPAGVPDKGSRPSGAHQSQRADNEIAPARERVGEGRTRLRRTALHCSAGMLPVPLRSLRPGRRARDRYGGDRHCSDSTCRAGLHDHSNTEVHQPAVPWFQLRFSGVPSSARLRL